MLHLESRLSEWSKSPKGSCSLAVLAGHTAYIPCRRLWLHLLQAMMYSHSAAGLLSACLSQQLICCAAASLLAISSSEPGLHGGYDQQLWPIYCKPELVRCHLS